MKSIVALALAAGLLGVPQFAAAQTAEQRAACNGDYQKFCKGTPPGGGRIVACLLKVKGQLTPACQKALEPKPK